ASVAAGTGPALATAASAPRSALASVIPSTAVPRSQVTFAVYCASARATSATLLGRTIGLTQRIKMRPNPAGGDFTVSVVLPGSIQPGTYHPGIECSDGTSTTARLLVPALGAAGGTSNSGGIWLAAGALITLGGMAGGIALRRRKRAHSDDSGGGAGPPDGRAGPPDRGAGRPDRGAGPPDRRAGPPDRWPDHADRDSDRSSLRF
ncbi:MAG TPA: hypothetical protein VKB62_13240, partial [Streptosporangiaceae bacterium]|nr:hypothetical protein [Streptosporangiaceae bacterium]